MKEIKIILNEKEQKKTKERKAEQKQWERENIHPYQNFYDEARKCSHLSVPDIYGNVRGNDSDRR